MWKEWGPAVRSGVVSAVLALITWAVGRLGAGVTMETLKSFVVTFAPVLVGLTAWLILWAVFTIHRIAKGRDKEFQAWLGKMETEWTTRLGKMEQEWKGKYEQNFRDREAAARGILADNSAAMQGFSQKFEGWLERTDRRLAAIETRLGIEGRS